MNTSRRERSSSSESICVKNCALHSAIAPKRSEFGNYKLVPNQNKNMSQTSQVLAVTEQSLEQLAQLVLNLIYQKNVSQEERDAAKAETAQLFSEKQQLESEKQQLESDDITNANVAQSYLNRIYELIDVAASATAA